MISKSGAFFLAILGTFCLFSMSLLVHSDPDPETAGKLLGGSDSQEREEVAQPMGFPAGIGVSPVQAAFSPVPLPVSGSCTAGATYTIDSMDDLYANIGDLECIYSAGIEPNEVPLGFSYGYLLSAANTAFWDIVAEAGYQGDYVVKTQCHGKELYIGWMSILGFDMGTAVWKIGSFDYQLAEGEYPIGSKKGIIMDFREDFYSLCSIEGNETPLGLQGFSPFNKSPWPVSQFVDFARVVGRDRSDGGLITLNKAYVMSETMGAMTILFYATKNFDPKVLPDFAKDHSHEIIVPHGPNGKEIYYNRGGLDSLLKRLDPLSIFAHGRY